MASQSMTTIQIRTNTDQNTGTCKQFHVEFEETIHVGNHVFYNEKYQCHTLAQ